MTPQQQARRTMGTSSEGYLARTINWKPVIAAVHGYALGAGTSIAALGTGAGPPGAVTTTEEWTVDEDLQTVAFD